MLLYVCCALTILQTGSYLYQQLLSLLSTTTVSYCRAADLVIAVLLLSAIAINASVCIYHDFLALLSLVKPDHALWDGLEICSNFAYWVNQKLKQIIISLFITVGQNFVINVP